MEQALRERMGDMINTRVIVRQGSRFSAPRDPATKVALGVFRAGGPLQMNPPQSATMTFSHGDRLVVLAEDDSEASAVALQRESA